MRQMTSAQDEYVTCALQSPLVKLKPSASGLNVGSQLDEHKQLLIVTFPFFIIIILT